MTTQAIDLSIQIHLTPRLLHEWQGLWDRVETANIFNSPEWVQEYLKSFPQAGCQIICAYSRTQLVAVLGLQQESILGLPHYASLGHKYAHRPCLLVNPDYLSSVSRAYATDRVVRNLGIVTLSNLDIADKNTIIRIMGTDNIQDMGFTLFPLRALTLTSSGEPITKAKNQLLKRARPILSDLILSEYRDLDLEHGLALAYDIDRHSSKQAGYYNVFADSPMRQFYLDLAKNPKISSQIRVYLLMHKSTPIAYEIGFCATDRYIDSERAYLDSFSPYTPGKVLLVMLAEELARQGFKSFDLGPGVDNLKKTISTGQEVRYNIVISRFALIRRLVVSVDALRIALYHYLFARPLLYKKYRQLKGLI